MIKITFTADDEEPDCNRCDNMCESYEFCSKFCGANNWWNAYARTIFVNDNGEEMGVAQ